MIQAIRRTLPLLVAVASLSAHAQFYKIHGGSISVGGTGQFSTFLTTNPTSGTANISTSSGGVLNETVSNKQQFTTDSAGFITSFAFHPVAWAGVEVNYGFTHYSERYAFNYSSVATQQTLSIPTDVHEATAAYQFHPKHIPFQPFVNIGGGGLDFTSRNQYANQWRTTGLLEAGFDIPTHNKHFGFRISGRSLYYRAPNFNNSTIATRGWRVTEEPSISTYYTF